MLPGEPCRALAVARQVIASARQAITRLRGVALADDFTGVPSEEWWRTRESVRDLNVGLFLLWLAVAALVVILLRKGILSLADIGLLSG